MAEVTSSMVMQLRQMTGAGMMECKKALEEANGDIEAAVDVLRTRGLAAQAKRADRVTNEGLVVTAISEDKLSAAIAEVNCETDFVSRNEVFAGYANRVVEAVLAAKPIDVEALLAVSSGSETVGEMITEAVLTIGENIQISRCNSMALETGLIASYIHAGGRIGVLVGLKLGNQLSADNDEVQALAKDIAMQVAAANPGAVTRDDFAPELVARELAIYEAQAAESGRPEEIQAKMVEGRMDKFYRESTLVDQAFIKDSDKSISEVVDAVAKSVGDSIEIAGFIRYGIGQS
ncbi:MAG: translation elongation factor Ts [Coriobacteriia bacterium]|nr:translation elongation factor Ts [Coriobacteriia bacterium]